MNKTISKNFIFVISIIFLSLIANGCFSVSSNDNKKAKKANDKFSDVYRKPEIVGTIKSHEITESSGLTASPCYKNVFWTHNDSGDGAYIFALDEKGEKLGTWKVSGAKNRDWEDIAAYKNEKGECFLLVADTGNNVRVRNKFDIYKVGEPKVSFADKRSSKKNPRITESAERIKFSYADMRHDAETLMINPKSGDIYILTKRLNGASGVYKISADYDKTKTTELKKIADFAVPAVPNGFLTGGDISPDGRRAIVTDYFNAYEIILPDAEKNFDQIWKQKPAIVELGARAQGEAVCYSSNGTAVFATSEKKNSPFIKVGKK